MSASPTSLPRRLKQTLHLWLQSLRDMLASAGPVAVLAFALVAGAYWWLDPQPPRTVTFPAPGEFPYYCDFHFQQGMLGSVQVVPEWFANGFE